MLRLLVIADVHYDSRSPEADARADNAAAPTLGAEMLRRALADAQLRGGFDAVALMGDLIEDAAAPHAAADLADLRRAVDDAAGGKPVLLAGGNHDNADGLAFDAFDFRAGLTEVCGYRFVAFDDVFHPDRTATRREADRRLLANAAGATAGPLVVLQHNPMNPPIDDEYPFMLTNREAVLDDYSRAGVLLSISGHYHRGQPLNVRDGVSYFTGPALRDPPFRYAMVTLDGRDVRVETRPLALPDGAGVVDTHAHTEFAYCGTDVSAGGQIDRARRLNLAGVVLAEHAPQLYCPAAAFWEGRHVFEPSLWRRAENARMPAFRRLVGPLRDAFVRAALEVELDAEGNLTLHDADREWADRILGAIHWLPEDVSNASDAAFADAFLRANRRICAAGVDVLAHPFRVFRSRTHPRPIPTALHAELADLLAETNTAAEVNFHINAPDPAFFAECVRRGVKIAFGSDAHLSWESGLFQPHLDLLRAAAGREDVADLLLP